MAKKRKKSRRKDIIYLYVSAFLLAIILLTFTNVPTRLFSHASSNGIPYLPQNAKNGLQLYWFLVPTGTDSSAGTYTPVTNPTPASSNLNSPQNPLLQYPNPTSVVALKPIPTLKPGAGPHAPAPVIACSTKGKTKTCCVQDGYTTSVSKCCPNTGYGTTCSQFPKSPECASGKNPVWCDAKPVIYLYPTQMTLVSVRLSVPGSIVASNPTYPVGGWQNIFAYPDGHFIYNNVSYKELFYEASITPTVRPTQGIIVPMGRAGETLSSVSEQLGLTTSEKQELLSYWLPRLRSIQKPYIFISVFSQFEKDTIDHVAIAPQPDTFIQMIFYFRGLDHMQTASPLILPARVPERKGFTAVEWGGIIDE